MSSLLFSPELLAVIHAQYQLDWEGIHGVRHWARVLENGLRLASRTGSRKDVVILFALFHDACRHNDHSDPDHGSRGAALAQHLRGQCFDLDDGGMRLLLDACCRHSAGLLDGNPTVQTCWDADRLDLLRVGIEPCPDRLGTAEAHKAEVIAAANARACADEFPHREEFTMPGTPR